MLDKDEGAKFTLIVLKEELSFLKLDLGVTTTDRDVVNTQITLVTTAELEDSLV